MSHDDAYYYCEEPSSKFLHDRPVPGETNPLTCILANGSRVFLRRRNNDSFKEDNDCNTTSSRFDKSSSKNLLGKSMKELLDEADRRKKNQLVSQFSKENYDADLITENDPNLFCPEKFETNLWVDKYSPKEFSQLLSPEKINREVLIALKEWDSYIFKPIVQKSNNTSSNRDLNLSPIFNRKRSHSQGGDSDALSNNDDDDDDEDQDNENDNNDDDDDGDDEDGYKSSRKRGRAKGRSDKSKSNSKPKSKDQEVVKDVRPAIKVILLCGPPGTGKTTLAHVLAKHCGYRPHEVNASDDRSAATLRDTMIQAMHGNTLSGNKAPNCIILDEIDGIDGRSSIDLLVQIINCPLKRKKSGSGRSNNNSFPLTRPLICICNDQYSPQLKELRKVAQIFVFTPPVETKLVQRLKAVCALEGLNVLPSALSTLTQAAGNDIRASINTLQFAAMRSKKELKRKQNASNISSVLNQMILNGLKDEQRDSFAVWREIFSTKEARLGMAKRNRLILDSSVHNSNPTTDYSGSDNNSSEKKANSSTTMEVMRVVNEYNDHSLIISGAFENYLKMNFNDPILNKLQATSEWLSFGDSLEYFNLYSGYGFHMNAYFPVVTAAVHHYCSTESRIKIDWPSKEREHKFQKQQRLNILQSLLDAATLSHIFNMTTQLMAIDVIANLADILSPKLSNPSKISNLSDKEKQALEDVAKIMKTFGISFNRHHSKSQSLTDHSKSYIKPFDNQTPLPTTLKDMFDPAIHHLLLYSESFNFKNNANTNNNAFSLNNNDNLADNEGLGNRYNMRMISPEIQTTLNAILTKKAAASTSTSTSASPHPDSEISSRSNTTGTSASVSWSNNSSNYNNSSNHHQLDSETKKTPKPKELTTTTIGSDSKKQKTLGSRVDSFFGKKQKSEPPPTGFSGSNDKPPTSGGMASSQQTNTNSNSNIQFNKAKQNKVVFKFNQGFTNAVKRPVSIKEFI